MTEGAAYSSRATAPLPVNRQIASMSAIGTKRTFEQRQPMSAFGARADIVRNFCPRMINPDPRGARCILVECDFSALVRNQI